MSACFSPIGQDSGGFILGQQRLLDDHQVGEPCQHHQTILVLGLAAVSDLVISEHTLDIPEGVLDLHTQQDSHDLKLSCRLELLTRTIPGIFGESRREEWHNLGQS